MYSLFKWTCGLSSFAAHFFHVDDHVSISTTILPHLMICLLKYLSVAGKKCDLPLGLGTAITQRMSSSAILSDDVSTETLTLHLP